MYTYELELSVKFTSDKPVKLAEILEQLDLGEVEAISADMKPAMPNPQSIRYRRDKALNVWAGDAF